MSSIGAYKNFLLHMGPPCKTTYVVRSHVGDFKKPIHPSPLHRVFTQCFQFLGNCNSPLLFLGHAVNLSFFGTFILSLLFSVKCLKMESVVKYET